MIVLLGDDAFVFKASEIQVFKSVFFLEVFLFFYLCLKHFATAVIK